MVTSVPIPPAEGIGYYVWNLSRFLMSKGHKVQIITRGQNNRPFGEKLDGIQIWRPRFYPVYPLHVHLHSVFAQNLLRRLESEVDVFHLHTPLPPPIRSNRPLLVTVHTSMRGEAKAIKIKDLWSLIIRLQIPVSVSIERELLANAHAVAAVAQSVANELTSHSRYKNPIKVLGNGVDITVFHPVEQNSVQANKTYILAAGRLDVRKGFNDLIEAMTYISRRHPSVQLHIAGTGPLEGQLQAQIERLRLDHTVRLLGQIDQPKLADLYQGAAVFAHAAHYEGLPTVLLEAMASGKAVVCTSVSGALDVVEDNANGILVPPKRPDRLAEAICNLLDDQELQKRLGAAARRTVEKRFSWQAVGNNYLHCYESLLAGENV